MIMNWCIEYSTASYVSNTAPLALFKEMLRKELLDEFGTRHVFLRIDLHYIENKDFGPISCHNCNPDYQLHGLLTVRRNVNFLCSES